MTTVNFKGTPVRIDGHFPQQGEQASNFSLVNKTLDEVTLSSLSGFRKVINIFPSIDTPTCATSVRKFNEKASGIKNTRVLCISADLPFAAGRFCGAEGIENVITLSVFRNPEFAKEYGVLMTDGPLKGLLARSVVVVNPQGEVIYKELVSEIAQEPDYFSAINSIV